ncbi:putative Zinc finger, RING-type [Arabidopsis thaliana]
MASRVVRTSMRLRRRDGVTQNEHQGDQQVADQAPTVPQIVATPPRINVVAIEDDDDVVESTASAFAQAKNKSRSARRGSQVVDVESAGANRSTRRRSDQISVDSVELNKPRKSKAVAPPVEEPKFSCPICLCPFTQEVSTKCGHIFCKKCIKNALSLQAKCPTCRKKITVKDLIRVFLPTTR